MLLLKFCCHDFCLNGVEIFELEAFPLDILSLFVKLLLFHSIFCVLQLTLGGNIQMNIFLETICQFDRRNPEEVDFGRGQSERFECL